MPAQVSRPTDEPPAPLGAPAAGVDGDPLLSATDLLDAVGHPMIGVDLSRRIVYWNKAAEAEFGWTSAEALGRRSVELFRRVESPDRRHEIGATLARGESWSGDYDLTRKDGSSVSVHVTNRPVLDDEGRLRAVVAVAVDASERRRLAKMVNGSGDAIIGVDHDRNVATWNTAAEALFGYTSDEIIGRPFAVVLRDGFARDVAAALARVLAGGSAEHLEATWHRQDRSPVDVAVTLSPTKNDHGDVVGMSVIARDVTERRDTQRALAASQQQLADAQRVAHIGSVEVDLVHAAVSRSEEFCRILGIPEELQHSDQLLTSVVDDADRDRWHRAWTGAVENGVGFDELYRIVRPDGETRWVQVRGVPERGPDGTVAKIIGTVLDDTERVEAELARQASEKLNAAFLDHLPVGVFIVKADGSPSYANRTATDMLGMAMPPGAQAGDFPELYNAYRTGTGQLYPADEQPVMQALAGRATHALDLEVHRPGRVVPLEVWAQPIRDEGGAVTHAIAVFADVTESRRAQETALFHAHLLDVAGQAIVATDTAGAITFCNRAAETLYGWSADEAHGRAATDLIPNDASAEQAAEIRAALADRQSWSGELEFTRRDGTRFPAFVTYTPILDDAAEVVGVIAVSNDITDRVLLEERFRQSQRLESLGQLAGGVAHDFNNLINVILNFGQFVVEATDGQAREDAEEIIKAGEAAARLTRQLLTFARREPVQLQALDLNAVVEEVHGLLARTIGEDIHLVVRRSELPPVTADRGQIEQILVNLAVNARDAMPDGGTLTIETSVTGSDDAPTHVHGTSPTAFVQLAVSDTGTGMSPDVAARAFEPFFTTKADRSGTGLGLATIHGIVTGSGGTISLQSEQGLGTTIRVNLPVAVPESGPLPAGARLREKQGHGQSVLVVEDHAAVRTLTVRMLRRNGYDVVEAEDPRHALALASDRRFDLLLTDVIMPDMSGRAVADHLTTINPAQTVLYMSGYSEGVLGPSRTLDPGVALIQKPFTELALLSAVSDALRSARGQQEPGS